MSRLRQGVAWFEASLVFTCLLALMTSGGEAAFYLGRVAQSDAMTDPAAIDFLVDPDPGFTVSGNELAKDDGSIITGFLAANFTVTEGDGITTFDPGNSLTAKWTLTGVPGIIEPIYYITKVDSFRDVWLFDTASGDTKMDLGSGLFTYMSVPLPAFPVDSPYPQGISHVSVFADPRPIPELGSLVSWSLIGILAFTVGWYRSRMKA